MNAHVGIDGLTALRRIDPDDAALGTALCALLRTAGMVARLVATDGLMFATEGNVSFAVGSIKGQAPILSLTRVNEAVAVLDAIDPLLVEVEAALGISLDAIGMEASKADVIGVHIARDNFSLTLAVSRDHARRADWIARAAALPPSASYMPVAISLALAGPRR